jgi:exonuclease SbcC
MILKRLLTSRWRKDKATRVPAEEASRPAPIGLSDTDPGARRRACKQARDPAVLLQVARDDQDAGVRELAGARLRHLFEGREPDGPELALRLQLLDRAADAQLAAHVALHGCETELRLTALERVADPQVLAESALRDGVAAVRLAAASRLEDKHALERVARLIGRRDKKVYRQVRGKLKQIAEQEQKPARIRAEAESLCERASRLGRTGAWSQDKAVMDLLERHWSELRGSVPADLCARFEAARSAFLEAYQDYRQANLTRIQKQEALERLRAAKSALLEQLNELDPGLDTQRLESRIAELEQARAQLEHLPEPEERELDSRWESTLTSLQQTLDRRRELNRRREKLQQLCEQAGAWLERSTAPDHRQVTQWCKKGDALAELAPEDAPAADYREVRERLRARLDKQLDHARGKLEQLPQRLQLLEQELDEGVLRRASSLHQSIMADLDLLAASGLKNARTEELTRQTRHLTPRLRELQSWRKWGTDQHRMELSAAMEQLAEADLPLDELTARVQSLQEEWKQLDHGGSPVNESLWQRFHQAGDRAYARCRPFLEEQAREREANRAARELICQQLESFLDQVDWERVDWRKAARAEREMRAAWGAIGPLDPRRRKPLDRRYKAAMKRLNEQLDQERARNRAFKEALISRAQALAKEPDLEHSTEEIKRLQQAWHTTVAARRKQENQLWDSFRAACDQVFQRRREEQQSQRREMEDHVQAYRELCKELESLAQRSEQDAQALVHALHRLQGRWSELHVESLPRQESERLQRRWEQALGALQRRVQELRRAAERADLDLLRQRSALCLELEAAVSGDTAGDADDWRRRWQALPAPRRSYPGEAGEGRFRAALAALEDRDQRGAWERGMADNLLLRSELCLKLEVLTGIDSPREAAQERLAFQVSRLSGRLAQGEDDSLDEAPRVEADWYVAGPAPTAQAQRLEARFERARQALKDTTPPARAPAAPRPQPASTVPGP